MSSRTRTLRHRSSTEVDTSKSSTIVIRVSTWSRILAWAMVSLSAKSTLSCSRIICWSTLVRHISSSTSSVAAWWRTVKICSNSMEKVLALVVQWHLSKYTSHLMLTSTQMTLLSSLSLRYSAVLPLERSITTSRTWQESESSSAERPTATLKSTTSYFPSAKPLSLSSPIRNNGFLSMDLRTKLALTVLGST